MNSFANVGLPAQTLIDHYRVVKLVASDQHSLTYDAVDERNGKLISLREFFPHKLVKRGPDGVSVVARSSSVADKFSQVLARAVDASRTLAEIGDRGLVTLGPGIDANGTRYQVTRPKDLVTLRACLTRRHQPVSSEQLSTLMQRSLKTLRTLHEAGMVHGAITPDSILVNDDLDPFLHLSLFDRHGNLPNKDASNSAYLSTAKPSVDGDLYALGACFYHCVAGVGPIDLSARSEELAGDEDDPMMSAVELGEGAFSKTSLRTIDWLLAPDPLDRPETADDVLQVVSGFTKIGKRGLSKRRNNSSGDPRLDQQGSRWRWLIPVVSFGVLAGAIWMGFSMLKPWVTDQLTAQNDGGATTTTADVSGLPRTAAVPGATDVPSPQSAIQPPPKPGAENALELTQNSDTDRINQYREQLERETQEKQIQARIDAAVQASKELAESQKLAEREAQRAIAQPLVEAADEELSKNNLLGVDSGALALYRRALIDDPDNPQALGGVVAVSAALADRAKEALDEDDTRAAEKWVTAASMIAPDGTTLAPLIDVIEARKQNEIAPDATEENAVLTEKLASAEQQITQQTQRIEEITKQLERYEQQSGDATQRDSDVTQILTRADNAFTRGDINDPADNNAVDLYKRALELDPQSIDAERGLARCIGWYADLAVSAIIANDVETARRYVLQAEAIDASHPIVQVINRQIEGRQTMLSEVSERETLLRNEADFMRIQLDELREELRVATSAKQQAEANAKAAQAAQASQAVQPAAVTPPASTGVAARTASVAQSARLDDAVASYYNGDYDRAFRLLEELANEGMARAQFRIAVMYFLGRGAPRDPVTAGAWLSRCAEQIRNAATAGTAWAESDLGQMYEEGWSVEQSYETAVRWYRRAATKGYPGAQNNLGVLYEQGLGVQRDRDQAVAWLRRAASQGDSVARDNLATLGVRP